MSCSLPTLRNYNCSQIFFVTLRNQKLLGVILKIDYSQVIEKTTSRLSGIVTLCEAKVICS